MGHNRRRMSRLCSRGTIYWSWHHGWNRQSRHRNHTHRATCTITRQPAGRVCAINVDADIGKDQSNSRQNNNGDNNDDVDSNDDESGQIGDDTIANDDGTGNDLVHDQRHSSAANTVRGHNADSMPRADDVDAVHDDEDEVNIDDDNEDEVAQYIVDLGDTDDDQYHSRGRAVDMDGESEPPSPGLSLGCIGVGGGVHTSAVIKDGEVYEHYACENDENKEHQDNGSDCRTRELHNDNGHLSLEPAIGTAHVSAGIDAVGLPVLIADGHKRRGTKMFLTAWTALANHQ